jgi:predicted esterase
MMAHRWWWSLLLLPLFAAAQDSPFSQKKKSEPKAGSGPAAAAAPADERPKLDAAKKSELNRLIAEYFKAKEDARPGILAQVEKIDGEFAVAKGDIDGFLRTMMGLAKQGPRHEGGNGRVKSNHPDHLGAEYIINAPQGGSRLPLYLSLHGGGQGVGDPGNGSAPPIRAQGPHISVYPAVKQKTDTAWNTEREERWVLDLIEMIKRTFDVDTNRIYLVGHSMGGFGTWSIGCNHADRFAGLAPMAGGLFPDWIIANLKNTPIWFYHSTDDRQVGPKSDQNNARLLKELKDKYGPYDYVYKEYNDIGHGYPREGVGPIFQFLAGKVRNPYPRHVIWSPHRSYKKIFYWLKASGGGRGGRVEARIDKGKVLIEGSASGLEILVNDKMGISMGRELVVERGGQEVYRGAVRYSVATLLESYEAHRDPESYFYGRVRIP